MAVGNVGKFGKKKSSISASGQEQLAAAIEKLEKTVDCEIVLVITSASNNYLTTNLQGALLGAVLAFSLLQTIYLEEFWKSIVYFSSMAVGTLLAMVPKIRALLIGRREMEEEVAESAAAAFLRHGLHRTAKRRGILLYLSLFERRIEIIGDIGIEQVVGEDFWKQLVVDFQRSLLESKGNLIQAIEAILKSLGSKLAPHFPKSPCLDQENQLSNMPIIE